MGEPGISLFQGNTSIAINSSALQREEEEEAIEDKRRRDEEIQNLLTNAFDDLSNDDDDDDCSSRSNSTYRGSLANEDIFGYTSNSQHNGRGKSSELSKTLESRHNGVSRTLEPSHNGIDPRKAAYKTVANEDVSEYGSNSRHNGHGRLSELSRTLEPRHNSVSRTLEPSHNNVDPRKAAYNTGDLSSENKLTYEHPINKKSAGGDDMQADNINTSHEVYLNTGYNSIEQLQVLYEVRLREIQHLNKQLEEERRAASAYQQQMLRKLTLCEAEKERAILSRTEANELLVKSKEEISDLQKQVETFRQNVVNLEKSKNDANKELEKTRALASELQQKITLMERCDVGKNLEKQTDLMVKNLKNSHQQQVITLQTKIDLLTKQLQDKETECTSLVQQIKSLQKAQETLLLEKSETVNQLAKSLEESQAQCRQLMASNVSCDNIRLQNQLDQAVQEKLELQKQLDSAKAECSMLRSDILQYESLTKSGFIRGHSSSDESDSVVQLGISRNISKHRNSNINITDQEVKLKEELHRALLGQKAKRTEIYKLQQQLLTKENQLQEMSKQKTILLNEMETLKETVSEVMAELKKVREKDKEKDSAKLQSETINTLKERVKQLESDNQKLEETRKEMETQLNEMRKTDNEEREKYRNEYMRFHDESVNQVRKEVSEEVELKYKEYMIRLEESLKELDEVKELYVNICATKDHLAQQLDTERAVMKQIRKERDAAQAELEKSMQVCDQLARRVNNSKRENDELQKQIKHLKEEMESSNNVKLKEDCEKYRSASIQRTKELSKLQVEFQASKQKVSQLIKEVSDISTEREQLKRQYEEKELELQKMVENHKKETKDCGTDAVSDLNADEIKIVEETLRKEYEQKLKDLEEKHKLEMLNFKQEYNRKIEFLEKTHQAALETAVKRHKEEIKKMEEKNANITEQDEIVKLKHQAELKAVGETAKQATVKFFTEEISKLEILYKTQLEELQSRLRLNLVENLEKALLDKTKEVEILKESLSRTHREAEQKIKIMEAEIENDRKKASQIMIGWAEEVKQIHAELEEKETTIVEMKNKIKKIRTTARKYKIRLNEGREQLVQQYKETLMEIQKRMETDIFEKEKEVNLKIEQMQQEYEAKEKHYRDKLMRKKIIS